VPSKTSAKKKKPDKLPTNIFVGDKVKLKPERIPAYREACRLAGWHDVDFYAIRVVIRDDDGGPGRRQRLFVQGPPHAFFPGDVVLAWNSDDERRVELEKRGHI
jgi:hypothetical protein